MTNQKSKLQALSQALKNNLKRRKKNTRKNKDNGNTKSKISKSALSLVFILLLASCSQRLETTGYFMNKNKLGLIKINKTSKQEVINILGKPTTKSAFEPEVYYYIERQYEQVAFFTPKLRKQSIISIEFDQKNVVSNIKAYNEKDAKSLNYDDEKVSFEGNKVSPLKQILENIGKLSSQAQKGAAE